MKALIWVAVVATAACGDDGASPDAGGPSAGLESGPCYGNGTCDAGLACVDNVCRVGHDGGSAGRDGGSAGRDGGSGGTSGGGVAGMSLGRCDTDNGGCDALVTCASDGATVTCGACPDGYDDTNGDGTACTDVDECATDNGGCGDSTYYRCTNNVGDAPTCKDIDECATDNGGCGNATYYSCKDRAGRAPTCADIDECETDNGGCGATDYWICTNESGAPPTCTDIDECLGPMAYCDTSPAAACTNQVGAAALCSCMDLFGGTGVGSGGCVDLDCGGETVCTADYPCVDTTPGYTCRGQFPDWSFAAASGLSASDGVVSDLRTGLQWQQTVDAGSYSWANAKSYCAGLDLATFTDWRLPTRAELLSIVDFGAANPAIVDSGGVFAGTPSETFWSSSGSVLAVDELGGAGSGGAGIGGSAGTGGMMAGATTAWVVGFDRGAPTVGSIGGAYVSRVRCVRP